MTKLLSDRRHILAGLLAAPMLIRTPGLLMPVRALDAITFLDNEVFTVTVTGAGRYPELADLARNMDPNAGVAEVIGLLSRQFDVMSAYVTVNGIYRV